MKNLIIVNCFDTYEERVDLLHIFFKEQGYNVTVIQSNFRHIKKVGRKTEKRDFIFVKTMPYYKNLSIKRLVSHYKYAKATFDIVERLQPNLLYILAPPNYLLELAVKYKLKSKNVKLIFDLIDLWPETMPINKFKEVSIFKLWSSMRNKNLKYADFVVTECDLYRDVLSNHLENIPTKTLYLAKRDSNVNSVPKLHKEEIHLVYLGSINNIIDIPKIKEIIQAIEKFKRVIFHIVGDGEKKNELISELREIDIIIKDHGKVYSSVEKQKIFNLCHFGLNIMKDSVCVGLTMKSIDYFQHSLPIINNIPSDTAKIVEKYNIGFNLNENNILDIAIMIQTQSNEENIEMRKRTRKVFLKLFSVSAFNANLHKILKSIEQIHI